MKNRTLAIWLTIISFIGTLVVNYLATNLPLNNLTTGEISDSFEIFFVPAGYVFSIWGLIYLGLIAYVIFQALPAQRDSSRLKKIDGWFILSNIANALWLVSWHYQQFTLSVLIMLVILISLIRIFLNFEIGRKKNEGAWLWAVEIPFSIYLGWISVATIANVTQLLYLLNWDGFGIAPQVWLVIMLAAAVVISALMSFTRRNILYALVLVWSFIGIAVKFPDVPLVNLSAWIAAGGVGALLLLALLTRPKLSAG
jgi:hypothetical protein